MVPKRKILNNSQRINKGEIFFIHPSERWLQLCRLLNINHHYNTKHTLAGVREFMDKLYSSERHENQS